MLDSGAVSSSSMIDSIAIEQFNDIAVRSFGGGFVLAITLCGIVGGAMLVITAVHRAVSSV